MSSLSSSRPVSLVASILLNPANRDKRVKGFKKQMAPLPWYTAQQAEAVEREQKQVRESRDLDSSSDLLLQRLKQKDMKMKRTLSQFLLEEDDTESVSEAKKSKTSTVSPESLSPPPRISSKDSSPPPDPDTKTDPPTTEQKTASGRYILDDDSDIDPREYELIIMEAKLNRSNYSENFTETDLQTTANSISGIECLSEETDLDKTGDSETREKTEVRSSTETESNEKEADNSKHTPDSSLAVTLTEEEVAEVTRHQFMLSYQSMCHVLGVSQEEGDKVLKSWQDSKDKPSGILKTPTEKFGTRPDTPVSDSPLSSQSQEKVVSFCLPTRKESTSPPAPDSRSPPLPQPSENQEPSTPALTTVSPPQGGLMSTPVLSGPSSTQTGTLPPALLSKPPPLPKDISIILAAVSQPISFSLPSTSHALSIPTQTSTPMVPSIVSSSVWPPKTQAQQAFSVLPKPTPNPTILPDNKPQPPLLTDSSVPSRPELPPAVKQSDSPFAFLSQKKPTTQPQSLLTSQTMFPAPHTTNQSSHSLFKLPNSPSQPQLTIPQSSSNASSSFFQTTSTPIQRGLAPQSSQDIFKTPNLSLFNKPMDKPSKPFHNLEISYSIPTSSSSIFPPPTPTPTQTTQPFSAPSESPVPNLFKRQHATAFSSPEPSSSSLPSKSTSPLQLGLVSNPSGNFAFKQTPNTQGTNFASNVPLNFNFGQSTAQKTSLFQGAGEINPSPFGVPGGAPYRSTGPRRATPSRPSQVKKRRK